MKTVTFMATGNAVKVTHPDLTDVNDIGVITAQYNSGFVKVNFGTHTTKHNIVNLVDYTYSNYEI